jgi:hypothetical protein
MTTTAYKLPNSRRNWISVDGDDSRVILFVWVGGPRYQVQYQSRGGRRVWPLAVIELTEEGWSCQGRFYDSYEQAGRMLFESRFCAPA